VFLELKKYGWYHIFLKKSKSFHFLILLIVSFDKNMTNIFIFFKILTEFSKDVESLMIQSLSGWNLVDKLERCLKRQTSVEDKASLLKGLKLTKSKVLCVSAMKPAFGGHGPINGLYSRPFAGRHLGDCLEFLSEEAVGRFAKWWQHAL